MLFSPDIENSRDRICRSLHAIDELTRASFQLIRESRDALRRSNDPFAGTQPGPRDNRKSEPGLVFDGRGVT